MLRVVLVATLATGCAQLFGLDTTSGAADGGVGARISFQRASVGAQLVMSPLDLTGQTATFLVADATQPSGYRSVPGVSAGSGVWTGDVPSGNPIVDFTLPSGAPMGTATRQLWAFPTRDVQSSFPVYEDLGATAPPANATLDLDVTISAYMDMTEAFEIQAIGAWSHYPLVAADLPATNATAITTSIPYASFTTLANPPIPRITTSDRLMLLRHVGGELTGVFETSLDEMDGSNAVAGTMQAVAQDQTFDAAIDPGMLATRYAAVRPAVTAPATMNWSLMAAPGYQQLQVLGPELQAGGIAMADTTIAMPYGNPFASYGWHPVLSYATYELRTVTLSTGDTLQLSAGMSSYQEPASGATLDMPAGLPQTISIDQIPLSSDNMSVTIDPTKYATVTLVTDHPTNSLYQVALDEVVDVAMQPVTLRRVVTMSTTDPTSLILPADAFAAGHTYTIEAICYEGGFVNAVTGDLLNRSLPFANGYNYSGVFTVANP